MAREYIGRWLISVTLVVSTWNVWAFNYGFGQDTVAKSQLNASVRNGLHYGPDYLLAYGPLHFLFTPVFLYADLYSMLLLIGHLFSIALIFYLFLSTSEKLGCNLGYSIIFLFTASSYTAQISRDGHIVTLIGPLLFLIWFGLSRLRNEKNSFENLHANFLLLSCVALTASTIFIKISLAIPANLGMVIYFLNSLVSNKINCSVKKIAVTYSLTFFFVYILLVRDNPVDFLRLYLGVGKAYSYHISGDSFPNSASLILSFFAILFVFFFFLILTQFRYKPSNLNLGITATIFSVIVLSYVKQGMTRISDHLPHFYLSILVTIVGMHILSTTTGSGKLQNLPKKSTIGTRTFLTIMKQNFILIKMILISSLLLVPQLTTLRNLTLNPYFNFFIFVVLIYVIANMKSAPRNGDLYLPLLFIKGGGASLIFVLGLFAWSNTVESKGDISINSATFSNWINTDNKVKLFRDAVGHVSGINEGLEWKTELQQYSDLDSSIRQSIADNSEAALLTFESNSVKYAYPDLNIKSNYVTEQRILDSQFIADKFNNFLEEQDQYISGVLHNKRTSIILDGVFGKYIVCNFDVEKEGEVWQYFKRVTNQCTYKGKRALYSSRGVVEINCPSPNEFYLIKIKNINLNSRFNQLSKDAVSLLWRSYPAGLTIGDQQSIELSQHLLKEGFILGGSRTLDFGVLKSLSNCTEGGTINLAMKYPINLFPNSLQLDLKPEFGAEILEFGIAS